MSFTYLHVRMYIMKVSAIKMIESITPTREIVFNDCSSSVSYKKENAFFYTIQGQ